MPRREGWPVITRKFVASRTALSTDRGVGTLAQHRRIGQRPAEPERAAPPPGGCSHRTGAAPHPAQQENVT